MYGWIWRTLPAGLPGKLFGSLVLLGGVVAVLMLLVFPRVEPLLPFQNVTVDGTSGPAPSPSGATQNAASPPPSH